MMTLFSSMQPVDSSSTCVRRTRTGTGIFTIVLDSLFCTTGFVLVYLILANFKYQSLSKSLVLVTNMQDHEASVMSTSTTDASFLFALMHLMDSGMDDLDYVAAGILLFVCFVALLTMYYSNQLASRIGFFDWCWSFFPTKRSVTDISSTVAIELEVNNDDDDDDDADDGVEEMDWEPTPDATFYHINDNNCIRVKTKSRIWYVPRRSSNPLYWRHPLLWFYEYQAASKIISPGRSFVKAGRALATIPEGVHFLEDVVSTTHIVPRDGPHEIARGRPITDADIDSRRRFFLSAGRAIIHFFTELASTLPVLMVVRRNGPTESDFDCEIDDDGFEEVGPSLACGDDDREVIVHEDVDDGDNGDTGTTACDDYVEEDVPFVHDDDDNNGHDDTGTIGIDCDDYNQQEVFFVHNDDDDEAGTGSADDYDQEKVCSVPDHGFDGDDDDDDGDHVDTRTSCDDDREVLTVRHDDDSDNTGSQSQATVNNDDRKESDDILSSNHGVLHVVAIVECDVPERTSISCAEDVTMRQVVQALPLRRSTRLAERRQRQQLHIQTNSRTTTTACETDLSTPDLLGSTFVNGRRRSSRHLIIKPENGTRIPCSGRSRRSRRTS